MNVIDHPKDKVVYLISPQPWDGFRVSKHHYAIELASRGNVVYFFSNTTTKKWMGRVQVVKTDVDGIYNVLHLFPLLKWLKFRARGLYDALSQFHINRIVEAIGPSPDIVWDFDNNYQFSDLRKFGNALKIFHPVDSLPLDMRSDKYADVVLAVAPLFIDQLKTNLTNTLVVPHGLNPAHAAYAANLENKPAQVSEINISRPLVGYVANFDIPGIDWGTICAMIERIPEADFIFIGPHGDDIPKTGQTIPISFLRSCQNVQLTGLLSAKEVLNVADKVDVWLLCNDVKIRADGGINSHKLLEYLATGKAVLSNWVEAYSELDVIEMVLPGRNDAMPGRLIAMLAERNRLNSLDQMTFRAKFAAQYSYKSNLLLIGNFLEELNFPRNWLKLNSDERLV